MGKSTQDDRQEKAKGILGEMLLEVIRKGGRLGIPTPGVAYVLMVEADLVTQNYVTHFGRMSYEDLKPCVCEPVEKLRMRLEQLPGQGVLGVYIEDDFVYSEILEVQTQRNASAGQARA